MRKRFESLWAIRPEATATVVRLVARDAAGSEASTYGIGKVDGKAALAGGPAWEAPSTSVQGKTTIIPIQGVLTNDGPANFGNNYQAITAAVQKAVADPSVSRIVLHVDSPGGEVTGLPETAAVIAAAAKVKPVSAIVAGASASAAYWLTSQASDITLTPSGEVGSVGVRMMHIDMSKMLEDEGYKVTEMHSGDFKTEWSPYHPLTDEAKADMQTRLDASYGAFLGGVTSGRGARASAAIKQSKFGGGRMLSASDALKHGMVDKLRPVHAFYRSLAPTSTNTGTRRARLEVERLRAGM